MKILSIFGTRPEAIKMAPLLKTLEQHSSIESVVCVTGQHELMLKQVLDLFEVRVHYDLQLMAPNQTLNGLTSRLFASIDPVLDEVKPDRVIVHGDTTSAMTAALSSFHRRIPVAHVEAGLRTGDMTQPWPEEMNRRTVDTVSTMLFAPTLSSKQNLSRENLSGRIHVTGNTVIDALLMTDKRIQDDPGLCASLDDHFPYLDRKRKLLLVTGHRRENFGEGFRNICSALATLALRPDIQIVYPVHLNPNVQKPVMSKLSRFPNVHLIEPLGYLHFVRLMQRAHVILTDSGGVQEEAPSLGKPVLVMRDVTERPEAVSAGTVRLVGTDVAAIVGAVDRLFTDEDERLRISQRLNPYGDGFASQRIMSALSSGSMTEFDPNAPRGYGALRVT